LLQQKLEQQMYMDTDYGSIIPAVSPEYLADLHDVPGLGLQLVVGLSSTSPTGFGPAQAAVS